MMKKNGVRVKENRETVLVYVFEEGKKMWQQIGN